MSAKIRNGKAEFTEIGGQAPTNDAKKIIQSLAPYIANVRIQGVADLLFHRWSVEAVEAKNSAAKGSKARKTDDIESMVYRNDEGFLCLPGEYLRMAMIYSSKFRQDPRSPRKSMFDLAKAALISLTPLASLGKKQWDYEHRCRVTIQRSAITRTRPAIKSGWEAEFQIMCNLPKYLPPDVVHSLLTDAGKLIGLADFRPSYGRFLVKSFDLGFE